jgi:menaquinone-dependent protoporphyrinogen oxidase
MARILFIYSTTDGHTLKIFTRLQDVVDDAQDQTTLVSVDAAEDLDPTGFDKIVIGASIRYGKHSPQVTAYIRRHHQALASRPNAFFSVNAVARKPNRNTPQTNPYLRRFLTQIPWQPQHLAVFAGKIDYPRYGVFDRNIIRLIMWITKGPTDPSSSVEFTDWQQVEAFGRLVKTM